MTTRLKNNVRRGSAVFALAGAAMFAGGGAAHAYPPSPTLPSGDVSTPTVISPDSPADETDDTDSTPSGTLPQTGGPGTSQILIIAGVAVAAGVVITGAARSRRDEDIATA